MLLLGYLILNAETGEYFIGFDGKTLHRDMKDSSNYGTVGGVSQGVGGNEDYNTNHTLQSPYIISICSERQFRYMQVKVNNDYDKNYSSLNSQLKQLSETYISSQNRANAYSKEVRGLGINIDILSGKIDKLSNKSIAYEMALTNESRSAQSLSARLRTLSNDYQKGKIDALEYKNGIKQLENELLKLKQKVSSTSSAINSQHKSYNNANAELKRMAQN